MRKLWSRVLAFLLVFTMGIGDIVPVAATNIAEAELVTEVSETVEVTEEETAQEVKRTEDTEQVESVESSEIVKLIEITEATESSELREETKLTEFEDQDENVESTERREVDEHENSELSSEMQEQSEIVIETEKNEINEKELEEKNGEETTEEIEEEQNQVENVRNTSVAASGECGLNATWTLDASGTLTISGTGKMDDYASGRTIYPAPWNSGLYNVKKIIVESGITSIGSGAFWSLDQAEILELPEGIVSIGDYAFDGCEKIKSIILPNSLVEIGEDAFDYCDSLTCIYIPKNVRVIGDGAFDHGLLLANIEVAEENMNYKSQDGVLFNKSMTTLIKYPEGKTDVKYVIPDSVNEIEMYAFHYAKVKEIEIVKTIDSISEYSFSAAEVEQVNIRDGVWLDNVIFDYCKSLQSFNVVETNEYYKSIDGVLFSKDMEILYKYPIGKSDTKYIVPQGVKEINESAFENSNLEEVEVLGNLKKIGQLAFLGCYDLIVFKTLSNVRKVGYSAFNSYSSNLTIYCPKNSALYTYAVENHIQVETMEGIENNQSHILIIRDVDTNQPISGAEIICGTNRYVTGTDGTVLITSNVSTFKNARISKKGYETRILDLTLDSKLCTEVFLQSTLDITIAPPTVKADIKLEHSVNFMNKSFKWLDLNYKTTLDFEKGNTKFPIELKRDDYDGTYELTFGIMQTEDESEEDKPVENKRTYDAVKNICGNFFNSKPSKEVRDFIEEHGWKQDGDMGVAVETSIIGFAKFDWDENGNIRMLESGAIVGLKGKGELKYRPSWGFGVVYAKAELSLTAEGNLKLVFTVDNVTYEALLELEQALAVGIGAEIPKVAHLEVGAEGKLNEKIDIPFKNMNESLEVTMSAELYMEAELGFWKEEQKLPIGPHDGVQLWPKKEQGGGGGTDWAVRGAADSTYDLESMELTERDYLLVLNSLREESGIDGTSVYPDGTPEMVQLSDGTILAVWVTDDGTKSAANRTTLVYSVNKGDGFSTPVAVCETGRADLYPTLQVSGDKAYLTYINVNQVLSDDATIEEAVLCMDVYYAEYENGSFTKPVLINDSNKQNMELNPIAVSNGTEQTVLWLENSDSDPFLLAGTNAIYAKNYKDGIWGETWCVAEGLGNLSSFDAAYVDGKLNVAYVADLDSSTDTTDDAEVFLYFDGTISRITSDAKVDSNVVFCDNILYWLSSGEIVQRKNGIISSTGITEVDAFSVVNNGNKKAIVIKVVSGFTSELYLAKEHNGIFESPVPITDFGNKISDYAAVYKADESLTAMIFETAVLEDEGEDASPYGMTSMCVYDDLKAANLILESVSHDESLVASGATVPVELTLYNGGSKALSSVKVILKKDTTVVAEQTLYCAIKAGEVGTVTVNYQLGDTVTKHNLTVSAEPIDYVDTNMTDNVLTEEVAKSDLALQEMQITLSEDGTANLTGTIANIGYGANSNVVFTLLSGGQDGTVIWTNTYGNMAAGAEEQVSYTIPVDKLSFAHENDGNYFYAKCTSDIEEIRYDNNSDVLVVFPTKVTGITLAQETLELTVKTKGELIASVAPANAMNQKIYYTTDNSQVAVADENGVITATGIGTATITAISADGGFAKSCIVTVVEAEEGTVVYSLDEQSLSLRKSETAQLTVSDEEGNAPTETITWTSGNASIATVDENGLVTGVAAGFVQIVANIGESFYDVCMVEVSDDELQSILFEKGIVTLTEGENATLSVIYYPAEPSTDKALTWTSSVPEVATVSTDGTVTAVSGGTTTITATSVNGKAAECKVTVEALPRCTVIFDMDLGTAPIEINGILVGETVTLPVIPERDGYTFIGWYTERNGQGARFTEKTPVTESLVVYAKWAGKILTYEEYSVEPISDQTYTGSQIKPEPVVLDGSTLLVKGVDYTLSYDVGVKRYC